MSVTIKSNREIELMREAGNVLAIVHDEIEKIIEPGITTAHIDEVAASIIRKYGCTPSFLNYKGYPASTCISVNEMVVHGIPSKKQKLMEGDIVSVDIGVLYNGYHSDAARTWPVGEISPEVAKLVQVTKESIFEGLEFAREGYRIGDISGAIQDYVESYGYSVVRELCGHGVGMEIHEDPQIPNFRTDKRGIRLKKGMTIAIEPMINLGGREVVTLEDGWGVVAIDKLPSSHYENTVLITDSEPEILSKRK